MRTGYCNIGYTYHTRVGLFGSMEASEDFCGSYNSWSVTELEVFLPR